MQNNFSLKFVIKDIAVLVLSLVLILGSLIFTNVALKSNISTANNAVVEVYYKGEKLSKFSTLFSSVENSKTITLTKEDCPDMLGDEFTILIDKEKGICVKDVECPNHYCEQTGWVNKINMPVTCLPNQIYVIIMDSQADPDFGVI